MRYYEDNINSNSYIPYSKNKSKINLKNEDLGNENKDIKNEEIKKITKKNK